MARLTLENRIRLETLLKLPFLDNFLNKLSNNQKVDKISEITGIPSSTIRKEVRLRGFTYDNYDAHKAHIDSKNKVSLGNAHYKYIEEQKQLILNTFKKYATDKKWSRYALLLRLKCELPSTVRLPSLETVYQWIYEDEISGGNIFKYTPRQLKKRKRKSNCREEKIIK